MGLKLITPPPVEPLTRADAYVQCQIDTVTTGSPPVTTSPDHDAWIDAIIPVLRNEAEAQSGRALVMQTWELWLDCFPGRHKWWGYSDRYRCYGLPPHESIYLAKPPLISVLSIVYIDTNGDEQTLDPALYTVDDSVEPARIVPAFGESWPSVQVGPGAVKVRYVAGYAPTYTGSPPTVSSYVDNIPKDIIHWMKMHMAHWFRNREASWQVTSTVTNAEIPFAADLLARYRVYGYDQQ